MHPWPLLLIPFVVILSISFVLAASVSSRFFGKSHSMRVVTVPRTIVAVSLALGIALTVDYFVFESREREVSKVVSAVGGELDHISVAWPGTRYYATFERPLDARELEQLSVLNSLIGRNDVVLRFYCHMEAFQLECTQDAFPDCTILTFPPPQ